MTYSEFKVALNGRIQPIMNLKVSETLILKFKKLLRGYSSQIRTFKTLKRLNTTNNLIKNIAIIDFLINDFDTQKTSIQKNCWFFVDFSLKLRFSADYASIWPWLVIFWPGFLGVVDPTKLIEILIILWSTQYLCESGARITTLSALTR